MKGDSAGFGDSAGDAGFSMSDQPGAQPTGDSSRTDGSGNAGELVQAP